MKKGSRGTLLVPLFAAVVIAVYLVLVYSFRIETDILS